MERGEGEQLAAKTNPKSTSYPIPRTRPPPTVRFTRWSLGVALRLFIWYSLFTALFRCPSNVAELDGHSPQVCQPYLVARSHVEPYAMPYYDTYAAPYVNAVQPYARNFHKNIYVPAKDFTARTYRDYAAPRQDQALRFIQTKWGTIVTPKLHAARDAVVRTYGLYLEPYNHKVKAVVLPVYRRVAYNVSYAQRTVVSPLYMRIEPIVQWVYAALNEFAANHLLPASRRASSVAVSFVTGTVQPRITGLYSENVEPQLVKIGNKLASYREGKENGARVTEEIQSTRSTTVTETQMTATPQSSASTSSAKSKSKSKSKGKAKATSISRNKMSSSSQPPASKPSGQSPIETAREIVAKDLHEWQEKFAVAADKGCEDLEERIVEIVSGQLSSVERGEGLVKTLESTAQIELNRLKTRIVDILRSVPTELSPSERETAQASLLQALRSAALAIREPAHALRLWSNDYRDHVDGQVTAAVESTLDILDGISDLGLQEIGMRWAWMDGVTYKDWAKYHALKKQLSDWRDEVSDFGTKHETYLNAKAIGTDILARGMVLAEDAAKRLTALKEAGAWKLEAGDDSDDFTPQTIDPAEFRASRRAALSTETEPATVVQDATATAASLAGADSLGGEGQSLPAGSDVPIELASVPPSENTSAVEYPTSEASELNSSSSSPASIPSSSTAVISDLPLPSTTEEHPVLEDPNPEDTSHDSASVNTGASA